MYSILVKQVMRMKNLELSLSETIEPLLTEFYFLM